MLYKKARQLKEDKVTPIIEDTSLLKELKEEVQREQIRKLVEKYWKHIIVLVLVVTVVSIGSIIIKNRAVEKREKYTASFYDAVMLIDEQDFEGGKKELKAIIEDSSTPEGIKVLANLRLANLLFMEGKLDKAYELYSNIRADKSNDAFIRDLAGVLALNILIEEEKVKDEEQINKLITELTSENSNLQAFALEQQAIFAIKQGDINTAVEIFRNLVIDSETPNGIRTRAKDMLGIYEKQVKKEKTVE